MNGPNGANGRPRSYWLPFPASVAIGTKVLAVALAALALAVGGAGAVSGTVQEGTGDATANDATVDATYTNSTVTVTVTNAGESVKNATIEVDDEEYKTAANGTVSADIEAEDCLEIGVETEAFEAEQEHRLSDGDLTLLDEEYEYGEELENAKDEETDESEDSEDEEAKAAPAEDEPEDDEAEESEDVSR